MTGGQNTSTKRGCHPCRAAHAKCDSQLPACGRCAQLKRDCVRDLPYPFRHSNDPKAPTVDGDVESYPGFKYAHDQVWISPPSTVEFVYEVFASTDQTPTVSPLEFPSSIVAHDSGPAGIELGHDTFGLTSPQVAPDWGLWPPDTTTEDLQGADISDISTGPATTSPHSVRIITAPSTASTSRQGWPLADRNEALLLRHFVTNLSQWFDYCDPHKTFATLIIQYAMTSRPLLYAIFATAARHLSMTEGYDAYVADRYHRNCLSLLIPMLNDDEAVQDEVLFAATVILRLFEEISVPLVGQDTQSHFSGTHLFVRSQDSHNLSRTRQAAVTVVLRQEIVVAFRTQQPVQLLPDYVKVDRSIETADEWAWAFHAIVHCAEVLNYCYGDKPKDKDVWDELSGRSKIWMENKPVAFEPLHRRLADGQSERSNFPEVWLLNDCHVAAHQHYLIAQILLTAHDPRRPLLGPGRSSAVNDATNIMCGHIREMCGITLSNPHCMPAIFTTSMVIALCGDLFTDRQEQKVMLDILIKTDRELGWPTASAQDYLREKWAWPSTLG